LVVHRSGLERHKRVAGLRVMRRSRVSGRHLARIHAVEEEEVEAELMQVALEPNGGVVTPAL